jgi:hypothetical protein
VAEEALDTARRAGARREEGRALAHLGIMLADEDPEQGLASLREARRIAAEQGDVDGYGWASLHLVYLNEEAGRLEEALAVALEDAEASGLRGSNWQFSLTGTAGWLEFLLGRWEDADRHWSLVLERNLRIGTLEVHTRLDRVRLDIARGDASAARRRIQEAEELAATAGRAQFDSQFAPKLASARAELALWEGDDDEAAAAIDQGLTALARTGDETCVPTLFPLGLAAAAGRRPRYCPPAGPSRPACTAGPTRPPGPTPRPTGRPSASPTCRPGPAGGRPRRCWPPAPLGRRSSGPCGRRTTSPSGWGQRRSGASWSCWPGAGGCGWSGRPSRTARPRPGRRRRPVRSG